MGGGRDRRGWDGEELVVRGKEGGWNRMNEKDSEGRRAREQMVWRDKVGGREGVPARVRQRGRRRRGESKGASELRSEGRVRGSPKEEGREKAYKGR